MPELPLISGAQAIRALEKLGFEVKRQRGSHIVLRFGSRGCVVPLHKELKRGTLAGVLRQADVSLDAFLEMLG